MIRVKMRSDKGVCKVLDTDNGEPIKGVARVEITQEVGALPIISLEIATTDVGQFEVEADAQFLVVSTTTGEKKPVKSIEFEDGEVINYGATE